MDERRQRSDTPLLDEWIAEDGAESVRAVIVDAERRIADGSLRGFTDRDEFFAFMRREHRRSA
ncbi:MAG: hypothetical protein ACR2HY_00175 [Acidimicrobiales bacterium]